MPYRSKERCKNMQTGTHESGGMQQTSDQAALAVTLAIGHRGIWQKLECVTYRSETCLEETTVAFDFPIRRCLRECWELTLKLVSVSWKCFEYQAQVDILQTDRMIVFHRFSLKLQHYLQFLSK